jgi:hypothetical protein
MRLHGKWQYILESIFNKRALNTWESSSEQRRWGQHQETGGGRGDPVSGRFVVRSESAPTSTSLRGNPTLISESKKARKISAYRIIPLNNAQSAFETSQNARNPPAYRLSPAEAVTLFEVRLYILSDKIFPKFVSKYLFIIICPYEAETKLNADRLIMNSSFLQGSGSFYTQIIWLSHEGEEGISESFVFVTLGHFW